jgi:hypothetical protein
MKVNKQFNTLSYGGYRYLLKNYQKYTDFNTLGLFRSIIETTKLSMEQKLELRRAAIALFPKPFDFLQLKDPVTYIGLMTLGEELTKADEAQLWETTRRNQQLILSSKKLRHRNFGTYSKHQCPYSDCPYNGLMLRQDSKFCNRNMHFRSDKSRYSASDKSYMRKQNRKSERQIIAQRLAAE